jgi:hypothetical protein
MAGSDDGTNAMTGQQDTDEEVRLRAWTDYVLSYNNRLTAVLERGVTAVTTVVTDRSGADTSRAS